MSYYKLNDHLFVKESDGVIRKKLRDSYSGLYELSAESLQELVEKGRIRAIETPEWSYFEPLKDYDIIMKELNVESLGDFAGLNPVDLPPELQTLQLEVIDILNPISPKNLDNCCGESKESIPLST